MGRRKWIGIVAAAVLLLGVGGGAAYWVVKQRTGDIHNGAKLPFSSGSTEPTTSVSSGPDAAKQKRWGPSWPLYGRSIDRRRDASDLTAVHPPYRVVWRSRKVGFLEYPPSYADGVLYLATNAGIVSARSVTSDRVLWSRNIGSVVLGSPTIYGGRVYFGSYDNHVYALDARNGRLVWKTLTSKTESTPAVYGGKLYMGGLDGTMRALSPKTGRVLWTFRAAAAVKHGPAVSGGRVYFGDYAGVMYCVRASDGRLMWRTSTNGLSSGFASGNFYSTPAVAYGRVYAGNTDGKVYSFVAATGQIAWTYTMPDWAYGSPAVSDGRVYATSYDGSFAAFDARTGRLLWKHVLADRSLGSPTRIGPLVYVSDLGHGNNGQGHLYAYWPRTGILAWRFPDGKYSSVIAADGRLIVAGAVRLYALEPIRRH